MVADVTEYGQGQEMDLAIEQGELAGMLREGSGREKVVSHSHSSLRLLGPGLLVCLADTDAGCLIVASQSGARWGYSLLLLQFLLIPVLFIAQELTIRLGIYTQKGHTACIREHFGAFWAWFSCSFLVIECVGAVISEMSGIASVMELWGCDLVVGTLVAASAVVITVVKCNYRQIETIGVIFGLFELTFVFSMIWMHPSPRDVLSGMFTFPHDPAFVKLIAANIGAVIMPWMIYFQQSAVVARRLSTSKDLAEERRQTLFGSFLTQLVMIGALVTMAASKRAGDLESLKDIHAALLPAFGDIISKLLLSLAFVGGSLCAAFVVALAAAWAVCEAAGWDDAFSLDRSPAEAPRFYGCFLSVVLIGAVVLLMGINVVKLNVFIELMDGLLMPMAVGFLYLLAVSDMLPPEIRLVGIRKTVVGLIFSVCTLISLVSGFIGIVHGG
jgi:NRAMP (natural resistance-associated macrophage protein)-like metal ion transporter